MNRSSTLLLLGETIVLEAISHSLRHLGHFDA